MDELNIRFASSVPLGDSLVPPRCQYRVVYTWKGEVHRWLPTTHSRALPISGWRALVLSEPVLEAKLIGADRHGSDKHLGPYSVDRRARGLSTVTPPDLTYSIPSLKG